MGDVSTATLRRRHQRAASNIDEMVAEFDKDFGLDKPLWEQYLTYMWNISHLDFGFSMASYPMRVSTLMAGALPWTLALLGISTALAFMLGNFFGALLAWPKTPRILVNVLLPPFLTLSAVPYYMLGLVLLWLFAFRRTGSRSSAPTRPARSRTGRTSASGRTSPGTWCCRRCRSCCRRSASGRSACGR